MSLSSIELARFLQDYLSLSGLFRSGRSMPLLRINTVTHSPHASLKHRQGLSSLSFIEGVHDVMVYPRVVVTDRESESG